MEEVYSIPLVDDPSDVVITYGPPLPNVFLDSGGVSFLRFSIQGFTILVVENSSPKGLRIIVQPPGQVGQHGFIFEVAFSNSQTPPFFGK